MKCKNCGAEFTEGNFCPECGTKIREEEISSTDQKKYTQEEQSPYDQEAVDEKRNKIPFYFSGWFILALAYLGAGFTFGITYIAGLILSIRRFKKFKDHKRNNRLILGTVVVPIVLAIAFSVVEGITDSAHSKKINQYINTREYDEARKLVDKYYDKGSQTYDMYTGANFKKETVYLCEVCGSLDIKIDFGVFGKKGLCRNCLNDKKKKIAVYFSYEKEKKFKNLLDEFKRQNTNLKFDQLSKKTGGEQSGDNEAKESGEEKNSGNIDGKKQDETIICSICGKKISKSINYCNYCGTAVRQDVKIKPKEEKTFICGACGRGLKEGVKFCNYCGAALRDKR